MIEQALLGKNAYNISISEKKLVILPEEAGGKNE